MRSGALALLVASLCSASLAAAEPAPEVLVTGHKSSRSLREPTLAASRIDAEQLRRPGASAAAVLARVPGVQVSETGAASDLATASIRGATAAQTPVYLAGIRLNDDLTGTADLSLIPLWMLSRVEVYRGNAPADADRLGIGGAVYFEPRQPTSNRVLAGGQIGSFGARAGYVGAEVARGGSAALVAFRRASARNDYPYLDNAGTSSPSDDHTRERPNADFSSSEAWAVGRTSLGSGRRRALISTVFNAFRREQGVTGLAAIPALSARAESARVLAGLSARLPCALGSQCQVLLSNQLVSSRSRLVDPRAELGLLEPRLDSHATRVAQSVRLGVGSERLRATLGANLELERLALDGVSTLRANRETVSLRAGVASALGEHTDISLLGVLTSDRTSGPARSAADELSSEGRVGMRHRFGAVELRGNLGRYVRVPTLGELYGISAAVRGSSRLVPEAGVSVDLGARWEGDVGPLWGYLEGFVFARRVSELIAYRRTSLGAVSPYNVGSARVLGSELEAGLEWPRHARATGSLTLLDPRDTSDDRGLGNDLIPYQSRLQSSLFVEGFVEPGQRSLRRAGLDARLSHRGSRLADPAGLLVLPASTTLDLGASLSMTEPAEVSLRAALDDVFGARRFDFIGYPIPGRTLHFSLEAWW